ncbi:MAG: 50S ribosomal protein L20 [Candidatus Wildermuthbacteria bacterium]|nr:50S ribosomal protein L20 [Candidatus Wildermuthbacteria bacterium]
MARVKRGATAHKRRKRALEDTKGFRWGRKSKFRLAKDALRHAGEYAFRDRKAKKGEFRALWQTHINSAVRGNGISYSKFASMLKKKNIALDRKILSELAAHHPDVFKKIIESAAA